ncbi:hypothetical protein ID866_9301 [Astraeus odoratus]|nr:hypothetical protein ID866_9301 [Astraeus odoratus]
MHFFRANSGGGKPDVDIHKPSIPTIQQEDPKQHEPGQLPEQQPNSETNVQGDQRKSRSRSKRLSRAHASPPKSTNPLPSKGAGNKNGLVTGNHNGHTSPQRAGRRTPSLQSLPESTGDNDGDDKPKTKGSSPSDVRRKASVRTARSTRTTATTATGAFLNGAALTGPQSEPDLGDDIYWRKASAERALGEKEKEKLLKEEKKEAKRLSKLVKLEATAEKTALDSALTTLASLQELYKAAIKREAKAGRAHARALAEVQKAESKYHQVKARTAEERARAEARMLEERAKLEGKQAEAKAQEERIDSERQMLMSLEGRVAECAREVERLRIIKATDERERRVKLMELNGKTPSQ